MIINKFTVGGRDALVDIHYEEAGPNGTVYRRIACDEKPAKELERAYADLGVETLFVLGIESGRFARITFSRDGAETRFRVEFRMITEVGDGGIKIIAPRFGYRIAVGGKNDGEIISMYDASERMIALVRELEERLSGYIRGERAQREFEFVGTASGN